MAKRKARKQPRIPAHLKDDIQQAEAWVHNARHSGMEWLKAEHISTAYSTAGQTIIRLEKIHRELLSLMETLRIKSNS